MDPVELRTERLHLRPWAPGDVDVMVRGNQDPLVTAWTRVPEGYTSEMAVARVADVQAGWENGDQLGWAVCDAGTGEVLAALDLRHLADDTWDVGFLCYAWARGRAVVAEAVRAAATWAFATLGASRVEWRAMVGNQRSRRAAEKAGFVFEGTLRGRHAAREGVHPDTWVASLVPADLTEKG
ncbi:MAG: GNAT family N-acetyltransferase [Mycobacteriales bacterium]